VGGGGGRVGRGVGERRSSRRREEE